MTLKLIGTGFGRTGTESMRMALNMLGVGPTHHMHEIMHDDVAQEKWGALLQGGAPDWDDLFAGYNACVDWPSAQYWPELMHAYPEAKLLLTWRDPESWWSSFSNTILRVVHDPDFHDSAGKVMVRDVVFGGQEITKDFALKIYRDNIENVFARVPAGRLIVHRLGDGWAPLCRQLDVAIPDAPYPSSNSTKDFQDRPKPTKAR